MIDLVGDDIIGAIQKASPAMGGAKQLPAWFRRQGQVAAAVPQQPQIVETAAGIPRRLPLPLPLTTINAGATLTITQRAQIICRAERLVLTSSQTPSSVQVQVFVGVQPQTVAAGFIPLDVFRGTAFGVELQGNTLQIGNDLSIQSQNIGALAETVGGAVIGIALQQ